MEEQNSKREGRRSARRNPQLGVQTSRESLPSVYEALGSHQHPEYKSNISQTWADDKEVFSLQLSWEVFNTPVGGQSVV